MKRFFIAAVVIISGLVAGCNQLTQYSVSEQEINQALAKQNNFSRDIGVPGLANAHITLHNLTSQIGRSEPDKVMLTGNADLDMTSLFGNQKAQITLTLRAHPMFNKEQGAVYLQEMEVTSAEVKPAKMQAVLQTITPYLNQALRNYFNQQPAYVLSADRSKGEAMAKKYAKGLEVKPGEIIIPFVN